MYTIEHRDFDNNVLDEGGADSYLSLQAVLKEWGGELQYELSYDTYLAAWYMDNPEIHYYVPYEGFTFWQDAIPADRAKFDDLNVTGNYLGMALAHGDTPDRYLLDVRRNMVWASFWDLEEERWLSEYNQYWVNYAAFDKYIYESPNAQRICARMLYDPVRGFTALDLVDISLRLLIHMPPVAV